MAPEPNPEPMTAPPTTADHGPRPPAIDRGLPPPAMDRGPWPLAMDRLARRLRAWTWGLVVLAVIGAGLGAAFRWVLPSSHIATAQILIDPRGLNVFTNDLTSGQFDANTAIGYVESQMRVITSERVLARVVDEMHLTLPMLKTGDAGGEAPPDEDATTMRLRPTIGTGPDAVDNAVLVALQRVLTIKRDERSYIVDVTVKARTPAFAARLANTLVKTYMAEEQASRAEAAERLTNDLKSRLRDLGTRLRESETRADVYRRENGLVEAGGKLVVEQKLAEAVSALGLSQGRMARAKARVDQLQNASRDGKTLNALPTEEDTRRITSLLEREAEAREHAAELVAQLGDRHPLLLAARSRVDEITHRIDAELERIRKSADADLERVRAEQTTLSRAVETLSAEVSAAHQAQIGLRALEQEIEANRSLLASFETRSREAAEFGRVGSANLRIVSIARPAAEPSRIAAVVPWGMFGAIMGILGGVAAATLITILASETSATPSEAGTPPEHAPAILADTSEGVATPATASPAAVVAPAPPPAAPPAAVERPALVRSTFTVLGSESLAHY